MKCLGLVDGSPFRSPMRWRCERKADAIRAISGASNVISASGHMWNQSTEWPHISSTTRRTLTALSVTDGRVRPPPCPHFLLPRLFLQDGCFRDSKRVSERPVEVAELVWAVAAGRNVGNGARLRFGVGLHLVTSYRRIRLSVFRGERIQDRLPRK